MKIIIIPDIHNYTWDIEQFLKNQEPYDKVIFLGDYWDHYKENDLSYVGITAYWLKASLQKKNRIHLLGNHDAAYRFSDNPGLFCQGFTRPKSKLINSIITQDEWEKIGLVHFEENFIFSHAGVTRYIFEHPIKGLTKECIQKRCDEAIQIARLGQVNDVWGMERAGGLWISKPGITWVRWGDLPVVEGWNQIVGHTHDKEPRINWWGSVEKFIEDGKENYFNLCLDSHRAFGILDLKKRWFGWGRRENGKILEKVELL